MKNYLPIGSVVLLKGGYTKLMIVGYARINNDINDDHDYIGCVYPLGLMSFKKYASFNEEDIKNVVYKGYEDDDFRNVVEIMNR